MRVKLLMQWDINKESENEYYEFIVNEFIPRIKRLGMSDIQMWYTTFGECEQIQASAMTPSPGQMQNILASDDWVGARQRLQDYVEDFSMKVVEARSGFQL